MTISLNASNLAMLCNFIKSNKGIFVVFIGAGGSISAGQPLGDRLKDIIAKKYLADASTASEIEDDTLEMVLHKLRWLGSYAISDILKEFLGNVTQPPLGYESLARLVKTGCVKVVLTVNQDELLEKAFEKESLKFRTIVGEDDTFPLSTLTEGPILFKLHGTISKPRTLEATLEDVQKLSHWKKNIFQHILENFGFIFIGYSARDPDILRVLENDYNIKNRKRYGIFWVSPSLEPKPERLLKLYNGVHLPMESDKFFQCLEDRIRFSHPTMIGILNGYRRDSETEKQCQPAWTHYAPKDWLSYFEREDAEGKFIVRDIATSQIDDGFAVVINPFGEVYPEEDQEEYTTFKRIKKYIQNGGIFVNAGGIAFFFTNTPDPNNVAIKKEIIVQRIRRIPDQEIEASYQTFKASLDDTLLKRHFGIGTTIGDANPSEIFQEQDDRAYVGNLLDLKSVDTRLVREFRGVSRNLSRAPFIPLIRQMRDNEEVYPLAAVPFERGTLILAGMDIQSSSEFYRVCVAIEHWCDRRLKDLLLQCR